MKVTVRAVAFLILLSIITASPALAGYPGGGEHASQPSVSGDMFYYSMAAGMTAAAPSPVLEDKLLLATSGISAENPYSSFTVSFTRNSKVSVEAGRFGFEHEPSVAVDPGNPDNIVVAAHHEGLAGLPNAIGVYYSLDGGSTWTGPIVMPLANESDIYHSDPALAATGDGVFYIAYMSIGPREMPGGYFFSASIVVAKSVDGGATWSVINVIDPGYIIDEMSQNGIIVFDVMLDKPYIAAARVGGSDIVAVTYTAIADGYDPAKGVSVTIFRITAVISPDGGSTWIGPSTVAEKVNTSQGFGPGGQFEVLQGSNPAVAPTGEVYVAYYDSLSDGYLEGRAAIMVSSSQDLGQTWSEPEQAAVIDREMEYYSPAGFRMAASMFPSMDVSPDGTIYIAYASATSGDPGDVS
ncbi:sialidase family protein [Aeropyrum camini]|uniref:sialidase family protein n=1 Tax=Aeropyrum camini TaxID=229980 RepID=UPI0007899C0F|nr:sialidase family protein [Aeropyrum camini]